MRLRLREFRIPDFPLGMLLATVLISISLLLAFPDLSTAWLWQLTVLIGTIAWALGAGWLAGPSSAEGRETHRDETAPTQKGQQQGPVSRDFAAIIDAIGAEGKANRNEERREDRDKRSREIVTIGIVAITGAAVIAQVIEMRRVYDPINEQARAARESLIVIQRPYISVDEPTITPTYDPSTKRVMAWQIKTVARNKGQTPADAVIHTFTGSIIKDYCPPLYNVSASPDPDSFNDNDEYFRISRDGTAPVGVGGKFNSDGAGLPIVNGSVDWNRQGYEKDYFFGSIHYRDMFTGTPEHITKFCFVLRGKKNDEGTDLDLYNAGYCPYWNCSDEECKADAKNFDADIKRVIASLPKAQQHCDSGPRMP